MRRWPMRPHPSTPKRSVFVVASVTSVLSAAMDGVGDPSHVAFRQFIAGRQAYPPLCHRLGNRTRMVAPEVVVEWLIGDKDRKSTRLNSSHVRISYAVFCLK